MAEVLGRYSKLGTTGVKVAKAAERARSGRRTEPWRSPEMTVTTVRRMTPEAISAMLADYEAGIGSWRLARMYGVSDSTVLARLKAAGIEVHERPGAAPQEVLEMARLRDEGWTQAQIGAKFGISRQAVCLRLKRAEARGILAK